MIGIHIAVKDYKWQLLYTKPFNFVDLHEYPKLKNIIDISLLLMGLSLLLKLIDFIKKRVQFLPYIRVLIYLVIFVLHIWYKSSN